MNSFKLLHIYGDVERNYCFILYRQNGKNRVVISVYFSDTVRRHIAADGNTRNNYRQNFVKSFVAIMLTRNT
jgi:hypothetical protein